MAKAPTFLDLLETAGRHLLACECGSMGWGVVVDRANPRGLELVCPLCHSHSGVLIPEKGVDSDLIEEALAEIEERDKVEREADEDWGDAVPRESKPSKKLLN